MVVVFYNHIDCVKPLSIIKESKEVSLYVVSYHELM